MITIRKWRGRKMILQRPALRSGPKHLNAHSDFTEFQISLIPGRLVEAGIDVLVIKQWLGHKQIETTQRYAKVTTRKLHSVLGSMGDLRAQAEREAQVSAGFSLPHSSPTAGGIDTIPLAA